MNRTSDVRLLRCGHPC